MSKKNHVLRQLIAREAARLMYEDGVEQYLDAKRKAAKRIVGKSKCTLPSNGEISAEIYQMAKFNAPDQHQQMLFEMRLQALDVMEQLTEFSPHLIGSVSTGRVRNGSDIDLHVFSDHLEVLLERLNQLQWPFELKEVWINQNSRPRQYNHVYLEFDYTVELSVYPLNEIRVRGRSSTDGKPIVRVSPNKLRELLMSEHHQQWQAHVNGESVEPQIAG